MRLYASDSRHSPHIEFRSSFRSADVISTILGVDIGAARALALVTEAGELLEVADMPVLRDGPASRPTVCPPLFAESVQRWKSTRAWPAGGGAHQRVCLRALSRGRRGASWARAAFRLPT